MLQRILLQNKNSVLMCLSVFSCEIRTLFWCVSVYSFAKWELCFDVLRCILFRSKNSVLMCCRLFSCEIRTLVWCVEVYSLAKWELSFDVLRCILFRSKNSVLMCWGVFSIFVSPHRQKTQCLMRSCIFFFMSFYLCFCR